MPMSTHWSQLAIISGSSESMSSRASSTVHAAPSVTRST